jgi:hypothetical protein
MNKRGQFYIIISVVLAIAVFSITTIPNKIQEAVLFEDFEDVSNNYIRESGHVINDAMEAKTDPYTIQTELDDFTIEYLEYARQRSPNLDLLYVYSDGTNIKLVNHFDSTSGELDTSTLAAGQDLIQDITIDIGGKEFTHKVPITAENFGYNWYSGDFPDTFDLSIGGVIHPFTFEDNNPELRVIINLQDGTQQELIYGSGDYDIPYSPPQDLIKTNQVKIR